MTKRQDNNKEIEETLQAYDRGTPADITITSTQNRSSVVSARMSSELLRQATLNAQDLEIKLNRFICQAIEEKIERHKELNNITFNEAISTIQTSLDAIRKTYLQISDDVEDKKFA